MIALPTIHLNGTGAESLAAGYEAAYEALVAFREKLRAIEFNSRDYYVDGPESWEAACCARVALDQKVNDAETYLITHLMHIHDQIK